MPHLGRFAKPLAFRAPLASCLLQTLFSVCGLPLSAWPHCSAGTGTEASGPGKPPGRGRTHLRWTGKRGENPPPLRASPPSLICVSPLFVRFARSEGGVSPLPGGFCPPFVAFSPLFSTRPLSSFALRKRGGEPNRERAGSAPGRGEPHEERAEAQRGATDEPERIGRQWTLAAVSGWRKGRAGLWRSRLRKAATRATTSRLARSAAAAWQR